MKERPILFSGEMVRAILDGRKTQTRRIVKCPHLDYGGQGGKDAPEWSNPAMWGYEHENGDWSMLEPTAKEDHQIPCPYGVPGDRLWVRESWAADQSHDGSPPRELGFSVTPVWYFHDHATTVVRTTGGTGGRRGKWRPSIHMPRWASRINLEITGIKVERLNDISEEDALAEGVEPTPMNEARERFVNLRDKVNGEGSFDLNPWVWVVEFRKVGAE